MRFRGQSRASRLNSSQAGFGRNQLTPIESHTAASDKSGCVNGITEESRERAGLNNSNHDRTGAGSNESAMLRIESVTCQIIPFMK